MTRRENHDNDDADGGAGRLARIAVAALLLGPLLAAAVPAASQTPSAHDREEPLPERGSAEAFGDQVGRMHNGLIATAHDHARAVDHPEGLSAVDHLFAHAPEYLVAQGFDPATVDVLLPLIREHVDRLGVEGAEDVHETIWPDIRENLREDPRVSESFVDAAETTWAMDASDPGLEDHVRTTFLEEDWSGFEAVLAETFGSVFLQSSSYWQGFEALPGGDGLGASSNDVVSADVSGAIDGAIIGAASGGSPSTSLLGAAVGGAAASVAEASVVVDGSGNGTAGVNGTDGTAHASLSAGTECRTTATDEEVRCPDASWEAGVDESPACQADDALGESQALCSADDEVSRWIWCELFPDFPICEYYDRAIHTVEDLDANVAVDIQEVGAQCEAELAQPDLAVDDPTGAVNIAGPCGCIPPFPPDCPFPEPFPDPWD